MSQEIYIRVFSWKLILVSCILGYLIPGHTLVLASDSTDNRFAYEDSLMTKDSLSLLKTFQLKFNERVEFTKPFAVKKLSGTNELTGVSQGTALNKITVSGFVRFVAIYRDMQKFYTDQETANKNLSFSDYPINLTGVVNNSSYPLIDLNISAKPTAFSKFSIGYSFAHLFSGQQDDSSKKVTTRSNLNFDGNLYTKAGSFRLQAGGGVLWTSLSPFTISNVEYRDSYFQRLPWDWYTNSFQKYQDYYSTSMYLGSERFGNAALQGFVLSGERLPLGLSFTAVYGRSVSSVGLDRAQNHFPSMLYAGRIEKQLASVKAGINYYNQAGHTDGVHGLDDKMEIATADIKFKNNGLSIYSELGAGRTINPMNEGDWGTAFNVAGDLDKSAVKIPLTLKMYYVDKNVVSLVSNSINSNPTVVSGGYGNDPLYSSTQTFVNVAQEVGQMSNNRVGGAIKLEKFFGRFNINLGTGISQEIENISDTITIQHRANAFSRSRFRPWYQAGGAYGRIKSVWLRTFETLTITDPVSDYKKGFNGIDLTLKYKINFLNKGLILINYNNYNSIQEGLSPIPSFGNDAFVRIFYEELTLMYQLTKKHTLVGVYEYEKILGNSRINLSPENGKTMDQTGQAIGVGLDYDFSSNAGVYFRHRWMFQKDKNFILDEFQGYETTIELKLFF